MSGPKSVTNILQSKFQKFRLTDDGGRRERNERIGANASTSGLGRDNCQAPTRRKDKSGQQNRNRQAQLVIIET
jgi:hypothetical protein